MRRWGVLMNALFYLIKHPQTGRWEVYPPTGGTPAAPTHLKSIKTIEKARIIFGLFYLKRIRFGHF